MPAIEKSRGHDAAEFIQRNAGKVWSEMGMVPVQDAPETAAGRQDPSFSPALMPLPSRLVSQFFEIADECSRGEFDGRPSVRDFDYVMDREGVTGRRAKALRALLKVRNREASAIHGRREKKRNK